MKYRHQWKGRVARKGYNEIHVDGRYIDRIIVKSEWGAMSPGGYPTNAVFVLESDGRRFASMDLAIQFLFEEAARKS